MDQNTPAPSILRYGLHFKADHKFKRALVGKPKYKKDLRYRKVSGSEIAAVKVRSGGRDAANWVSSLLLASKPKPPAMLKPGGTKSVEAASAKPPPPPPKPPGKKKHAPAKKPAAPAVSVIVPPAVPTPSVPKAAPIPMSAAPSPPGVPVLPPAPAVPKVKRALLIGINYIGSDNALNGCIRDIQDMKKMLLARGYQEEHIRMMSDDQKDSNRPTRKNLIDAFVQLIAQTQQNDEVFIHYSGHGTQVPCSGDDEALNPDTPNQDDAICPVDFDDYPGEEGFIVDDELKKILVDKLPLGVRLRVFFDCCHSGSALDLPLMYVKDDLFMKDMKDQTASNAILISGCKDSQTSADAYISGKYNGALTWAIIKSMTALKDPTWEELLMEIRSNLKAGRYNQIPMLSVGAAELGSSRVDL